MQLTFPPEAGVPGRTIKAISLDAKGEPGRGLTRAQFTGSVQYREQGGDVDRAATSTMLDLGLKPGMSSIEDARFLHNVRFEEGAMAAVAASARYRFSRKGRWSSPAPSRGALVPHVVNQQIVVDCVDGRRDAGRSEGQGRRQCEKRVAAAEQERETRRPGNNVKMPSMLKQDQAVIVVADTLDYDGTTSTGTYTGTARLLSGGYVNQGRDHRRRQQGRQPHGVRRRDGTTTVLEETNKDKQKQRSQSIANAKDLKYDDDTRRMTYTGDAHMSGPDGDMTATRIELYLKPSGDELDRAEAYENLTLREQNRETKGARMTYTTADEKYIVTGARVKIVDECQRETIGRTLTFIKATDTIVIDGNSQIRTQTKGGGGKCPG